MSLVNGDLTTLTNAKLYLDNPPSDQILSGLITRISRMILTTLNRSVIIPHVRSEQFDGTGTTQLVLPNWPLIGTSLTSLKISGATISLAPQESDQSVAANPYGYRVQPVLTGAPPGNPAVVELVGGAYFIPGHQNVLATYMAGYQISGEAQTVSNVSPQQVTPNQPFGTWATDGGVTYAATGTALVAVSSSPTLGQYVPPKPDGSSPSSTYTFSAADAGASVLLSYGYVPADIEQVVLEIVAERAAYRKRVGVHSQSLGGQETITYDLSGLNKWVIDALWPYVSVIPPAIGAPV